MKKLTLSGVISAPAACGGGGGDSGQPINPFWSQTGLVVADFNGDGRVDVAVASTYIAGPPRHPGYAEVYLQATSGSFLPPVRCPVGPDPWGMSAGDVDNDGHLDLVVADLNGDGRTDIVVANAGHAQIPVADGARRVAIADLNGDSIPDIALRSMVYQALSTPSRISVLLQSSTARGQFAAANT